MGRFSFWVAHVVGRSLCRAAVALAPLVVVAACVYGCTTRCGSAPVPKPVPAPPPKPAAPVPPAPVPAPMFPESPFPKAAPAVFDPPTLRRPATPPVWAADSGHAAGQLDAWVAALGADRWAVRDAAHKALASAGFAALSRLEAASMHPDPEVRKRARRLAADYYSVWPTPARDGSVRLLPPIYCLTGWLGNDPERIVPHPGDADRPPPPLGLPQPVGFASFADLPTYWSRRFGNRLAGDTHKGTHLAVLAHGYFLRASTPQRVAERGLPGNAGGRMGRFFAIGRWYYGGDAAEREATGLLVRDLLRQGVSRDWVRALLDDLCCRSNPHPASMPRPSPALCRRFGLDS